MSSNYLVVFDEVIKSSLEKIILKGEYRQIIKQWLDKLEDIGPKAGKLLDNHVWLYEIKNKRPPLRLYFCHQESLHKIIIFEVEMKTSKLQQKKTINTIRRRLSDS